MASTLLTAGPGVFLSHNHADKPFVRRLARDLKKCGARVWVDEAEILIGESLLEKVGSGIDAMDFLAVVLSPSSVKSEWVKREVEIAMHAEFSGRTVKVLPIVLGKCELPPFLRMKLYADFTEEARYPTSLQLILKSIGLDFSEPLLTESECLLAINAVARHHGPTFPSVEASPISSFGTASFRAWRGDGKGAFYCHASGREVGRVFYVRKGIGHFYHFTLRGPLSELGLPTSNEELVDGRGLPTSFFEGGRIEYNSTTRLATAYAGEPLTVLAEHSFGKKADVGSRPPRSSPGLDH